MKTTAVSGYRVYNSQEIDKYLNEIKPLKYIRTNKKIQYANIACSFDIETTSIVEDGEKGALMYVWQLSIDNNYIMGRTWGDFLYVYEKIVDYFSLNENKRLVIYVHNLSFEFQFMSNWFNWLKVFSIDSRKPVQAVTTDGVEFRCSYLLSGFSLSKLGDQLIKYKANKKSGDLDYSKKRHSKTPLIDRELEYCIADIEVVTNYIKECIENDGNITRIPLTKTGYVRNYCRERCFMIPHGRKVIQNIITTETL